MKYRFLFLITILIVISSTISSAQEVSGNIGLEGRLFFNDPLLSEQKGSGFSLTIQPEAYFDWDDGNQSLLFVPFARIDQHDKKRTHFDIRELFWLYYTGDFEFRVGIRKVFWGVTESAHLVDVINQIDFVENLDGEQKLGQPMVDVTYIHDYGTLQLFVMPYFRTRNFHGEKGRLRFPFLVSTDEKYESGSKEKNVDLAIRYSNTFGDFDFGLSHFYGNSREPRFDFNELAMGKTELTPHYDLIHQTGIDIQFTSDAWLWKFEGISREARGKRLTAFTGGLEYTFGNIDNSGIDIGIVAEYLFDDRNQTYFPANPFDNHTFLGSRLAFNDVQSTDILAGIIYSNEKGSIFANVEASRRIGDNFKLILEFRGFTKVKSDELFYGFRKDSYIQTELEWYF